VKDIIQAIGPIIFTQQAKTARMFLLTYAVEALYVAFTNGKWRRAGGFNRSDRIYGDMIYFGCAKSDSMFRLKEA